jgi:hypothetical protein
MQTGVTTDDLKELTVAYSEDQPALRCGTLTWCWTYGTARRDHRRLGEAARFPALL